MTIEYVREYILHANESILRMRTSGAAPMFDAGSTGSSVLVQFPLAEGVQAAVTHGTPHHWTANGMSDPYWNGITFLPTHHFVMPYAAGSRCAIYHADVHAWGTDVQQGAPGDGVLYGCLWRNGNGSYFNWVTDPGTYMPYGTDPETHVREYAIDVNPYAAATGLPLRASLAFASPLRGLVLEPIASALGDQLSLVSCSDGASVTVAKAGTMQQAAIVLRVYAPTASADNPTSVTLTLDSRVKLASAAGITALEGPLAEPIAVQVYGQTIAFLATTALTTIAIS
ncbi:MAG TPA: hypothetical protein VFP80_13280 [Thermoanaerobaculia bacterium]|nr:hypothetical protein [Thermoanaerobaculia bacterium]